MTLFRFGFRACVIACPDVYCMTKLAATEKNLHLFFKRAQKSQREAGYLCRSLDFLLIPF